MNATLKRLLIVALVVVIAVEAAKKGKKKGNKGNKKATPGSGQKFEFTARGPFFTIPADIGSWSESFTLGVESYYGASILYGPGVQCNGMDSYCVDHKTYDPKVSTTYTVANNGQSKQIPLSLGTVQAVPGSDTIMIGQMKADNAMFASASSGSTNLLRKSRASGYLAMGSPMDKDEDKTTMQLLIEKAPMPIITFVATKDLNGDHSITIGAEDTKHCPTSGWMKFPAATAPIDPNHAPWIISFSGGFTMGSISDKSRLSAAMSTAGDYFVAPKRIANQIYKQLGASYSQRFYGGTVDCSLRNTAANIVFHTDQGDITVTPMDYIKRFTASSCLINIYPDDLNMWTLPYQFHQGRCIKYDYGNKEVSIVMASNA